MRLELTGRHITVTPTLRNLVEQRLAHTLRKLNDNVVSVQVVLTKEKTRLHADVMLHARGEHFLHGEAAGRDAQTALGSALDKIERQAQKVKEKWTTRKRRSLSTAQAASVSAGPDQASTSTRSAAAGASEDGGVRIIRARRYAVKPMSVDEAALEVGAERESFIVFRNASTDTINVLFRRADGHLGLIEPDA